MVKERKGGSIWCTRHQVKIPFIFSIGDWFVTTNYKPLKTDVLWATRILISGICFSWSHQTTLFHLGFYIFIIFTFFFFYSRIPGENCIMILKRNLHESENEALRIIECIICIFCIKHKMFWIYIINIIKLIVLYL